MENEELGFDQQISVPVNSKECANRKLGFFIEWCHVIYTAAEVAKIKIKTFFNRKRKKNQK